MTAAGLIALSVDTAFEISPADEKMRPLIGVGQKPSSLDPQRIRASALHPDPKRHLGMRCATSSRNIRAPCGTVRWRHIGTRNQTPADNAIPQSPRRTPDVWPSARPTDATSPTRSDRSLLSISNSIGADPVPSTSRMYAQRAPPYRSPPSPCEHVGVPYRQGPALSV